MEVALGDVLFEVVDLRVGHEPGRPAVVADVDAFARALKASAKPILAHCRSGTRCYLLWAATQAAAGNDVNQLVMRAAGDGYDIRVLPDLMQRLGKR